MEVFWPGSSPDAARNSLHVAMHALRKALAQAWDGSVVECRGDTYRLSDTIDVWSDVAELERRCELGALAAADAGWTRRWPSTRPAWPSTAAGEFMADDPYLEWAVTRREELRLRAVDCAEQLSELQLRRGDLRRALASSSQVLREEPCHEPRPAASWSPTPDSASPTWPCASTSTSSRSSGASSASPPRRRPRRWPTGSAAASPCDLAARLPADATAHVAARSAMSGRRRWRRAGVRGAWHRKTQRRLRADSAARRMVSAPR